MSHKERVLHWLKHSRDLVAGKNLYNTLPGKNLAVQHSLNSVPASPKTIKYLAFEMCKIVGIADGGMNALLNKPLIIKNAPVTKAAPVAPTVSLQDQLLDFTYLGKKHDFVALKAFAKALKENLDAPIKGKSKKDIAASIEQFRDATRARLINEIPAPVKQSLKLREQFPFLTQEDCPDILKVLVNDMITGYHNFREGHGKLLDTMTKQESAALVATVKDNYIANQDAWKELEHYKANGTFLGEHLTISEYVEMLELKTLNANDLNKRLNNVRSKKSRFNKQLSEAENGSEDEKRIIGIIASADRVIEAVRTEMAKR